MTIQCNGYPTPPMGERGRAKMMILEELIKEAELDMLLTQEENRDWSRVEDRDKPKHKFDRSGIVTNHAHNIKETVHSGVHLQGGTAV